MVLIDTSRGLRQQIYFAVMFGPSIYVMYTVEMVEGGKIQSLFELK